MAHLEDATWGLKAAAKHGHDMPPRALQLGVSNAVELAKQGKLDGLAGHGGCLSCVESVLDCCALFPSGHADAYVQCRFLDLSTEESTCVYECKPVCGAAMAATLRVLGDQAATVRLILWVACVATVCCRV